MPSRSGRSRSPSRQNTSGRLFSEVGRAYLEFLFVRVRVGELDYVVGQGLHFSVYTEAVAIDLGILLGIFEI